MNNDSKEEPTNLVFSPQQHIQISDACMQIQNAINTNFAKVNEELIHKAEKITLKQKKFC